MPPLAICGVIHRHRAKITATAGLVQTTASPRTIGHLFCSIHPFLVSPDLQFCLHDLEGHESQMADPQPQAIPAVEKVPDEIWHNIFMHVALDRPQRDERGFPTDGPHPLLPVVQANKRFNAVAGPLLVTNWHLTPFRESGAKFALHLLEHPHLRSRVKSLGLSVLTFSPARPEALRASLRNRWPSGFIPAAEAEQLVESAEKTCPPLAELEFGDWEVNWTDQIGKRSPDAISALVLAWATELQELDLTWDDDSDDMCGPYPWLIRLVKLAVGVLSPSVGQGHGLPRPALFQNLHSVTLWRCTYASVSSPVDSPWAIELRRVHISSTETCS